MERGVFVRLRALLRRGARPGLIPTAAALAAVFFAGCDRSPIPTSAGPAADAATRQAAAWQSGDRGEAAVELTRLVARAFADAGLRNRVKNDMRTAPFLEHKLELSSYLKGESGGILLAKMVQRSDRSRGEVLALLEELEPQGLEFYMPYDEHRTTWTGGTEVVIASQLDEGQTPAAFTTGGERFDLRLEALEKTPDRPVLSLVPTETDFDSPLPEDAVVNSGDRNGRAIGVYREAGSPAVSAEVFQPIEDDDGGSGGGGGWSWSDLPPGLYMHGNYIDDLGEGGLKGDPELEAHLVSPTDASPDTLQDVQCAGEHELGAFNFNQDDHQHSDPVRVATKTQIEDFQGTFGSDEAQGVFLIEDDDTTCEIKMDDGRFEELINATAEAVGFDDGIHIDLPNDEAESGQIIRRIITAAVNFFQSADDEVGFVVEGTSDCGGSYLTDREWLIQRGSEVNGCTMMRMNDP